MRLAVRIALWALLLGGSAATGAFIAAHSNPLPPQVASSAPSPSAAKTPPPKPDRWVGTMRSTSFHQLYVGGTCDTDWSTTLRFAVSSDGVVDGTGVARLTSKGTPCPFAVAQPQIRRFDLKVTGTMRAGKLEIRLLDAGHVPASGSDDLGGFRATALSVDLHLGVRLNRAAGRLALQAPDQDRGTFGSVNVIRLRCKTC